MPILVTLAKHEGFSLCHYRLWFATCSLCFVTSRLSDICIFVPINVPFWVVSCATALATVVTSNKMHWPRPPFTGVLLWSFCAIAKCKCNCSHLQTEITVNAARVFANLQTILSISIILIITLTLTQGAKSRKNNRNNCQIFVILTSQSHSTCVFWM